MDKSQVTIDNITFSTCVKEITDCNVLEVEAGTTGNKGGDSGHGGRTYFRIKDLGSTDMRFYARSHDGEEYESEEVEEIEIRLGGDAELKTFTKALRFAVSVLEPNNKADGAQSLNSAYEEACNNYLRAFCELYDYRYENDKNQMWVGYKPGTVCDAFDMVMNMDDIVLCVNEQIPEEELFEWSSYNSDAAWLGLSFVNLSSWHKGYHGMPKESMDRIRLLRKEIDDLVEEENGKYAKGGF